MIQSVYTAISKKIGWQGSAEIPSISEAQQLKDLVNKSDAYAFEKVFKIHRFSASPVCPDQSVAMSIVFEAFGIGSNIFKEMEAK